MIGGTSFREREMWILWALDAFGGGERNQRGMLVVEGQVGHGGNGGGPSCRAGSRPALEEDLILEYEWFLNYSKDLESYLRRFSSPMNLGFFPKFF
jgi:hypothetical protein